MHEAGHVVIGVALFGGTGGAVVTPAGGGIANTDFADDGGVLPYFRHAVHAAAGKAAEPLVQEFPAPCDISPQAKTVDATPIAKFPTPPTREEIAAATMPDHVAVTYCASRLGIPKDLEFIWRRCVNDCARELVERHQYEIVNSAHTMFRTRRLTIQSQNIDPAQSAPDTPAATAAQQPAPSARSSDV